MKRWLASGALFGVVIFGSAMFTPGGGPAPGRPQGASAAPCRAGEPRNAGQGATVAQAAYRAGFRGADLVIAVAVAKAESGWDPSATNANTNGSTDYGLFQINSVHAAILAGGDWSDPQDNAVMAHQVWLDAGSSWSPWVTYWSGSYRQWMRDATAATSGVAGCPAVTDPGPGPQGTDGLTPRAAAVKATTIQRWGCARKAAPCVPYVGGFARRNIAGTNVPSDHSTGNAADVMLPADYRSADANALGWEVARFWQENAGHAGIKYIIFDAKIWDPRRGAGWRPYLHPGGTYSDVLQHLNHVHISVLSGS